MHSGVLRFSAHSEPPREIHAVACASIAIARTGWMRRAASYLHFWADFLSFEALCIQAALCRAGLRPRRASEEGINMPNRSGCLVALLVFLAVTNVIGLYLFIDSQSRFTQTLARNTEQLQRLDAKLEKLASLPSAPAHTNAGQASTPTATTQTATTQGGTATPAAAPFANSEFRQPQAESGGTRVTVEQTFSGNFNYIVQNESVTGTVWDMCVDQIAERNLMRPEEFQPVLAERWSVSGDGLVYDIMLKKGALWHPYVDPVTKKEVAAKEVTAEDFVFYWQTLNNPDIPCDPLRVYFSLMKSIEAVGPYQLRVTWKEPYSKAQEITLGLMPLPKHYYRPDPSWTDKEFAEQFKAGVRNQFVVGCGAFRFAEFKPNEFIRFDRFEDYYGPKPYLKSMVMKVIPEQSVAFLELKKGAVDELGLVPEQWVKETPEPLFHTVTPDIKTAIADSLAWDEKKQAGTTGSTSKLEKYQYNKAATAWTYIGYNLRKPVFADKATRQALAHLTDRQRIIKEVSYNLAVTVDGPFTPNCPYADPSVKPYEFDPAKAAALLKSAGWADTDGDGILDKEAGGQRIKLSYSLILPQTSVNGRKIASILQSDLRKAGVELQVQPLEWSVMIQRLEKHNFDACFLGWTGVLEPDPYQVWHSSQADIEESSNHVGFKNKRADELIEQGRRTIDVAKRTEIYREFYRILHDEQPYTFLIAPTSLLAQDAKFRNARVYPLGMSTPIAERLQWLPLRQQGQ